MENAQNVELGLNEKQDFLDSLRKFQENLNIGASFLFVLQAALAKRTVDILVYQDGVEYITGFISDIEKETRELIEKYDAIPCKLQIVAEEGTVTGNFQSPEISEIMGNLDDLQTAQNCLKTIVSLLFILQDALRDSIDSLKPCQSSTRYIACFLSDLAKGIEEIVNNC